MSYADTTAELPRFRRLRRLWLRAQMRRSQPRVAEPGSVLAQEWGLWVLRPTTGIRRVRWVTLPLAVFRDREAALNKLAASLS